MLCVQPAAHRRRGEVRDARRAGAGRRARGVMAQVRAKHAGDGTEGRVSRLSAAAPARGGHSGRRNPARTGGGIARGGAAPAGQCTRARTILGLVHKVGITFPAHAARNEGGAGRRQRALTRAADRCRAAWWWWLKTGRAVVEPGRARKGERQGEVCGWRMLDDAGWGGAAARWARAMARRAVATRGTAPSVNESSRVGMIWIAMHVVHRLYVGVFTRTVR